MISSFWLKRSQYYPGRDDSDVLFCIIRNQCGSGSSEGMASVKRPAASHQDSHVQLFIARLFSTLARSCLFLTPSEKENQNLTGYQMDSTRIRGYKG